MAGNANNRVNYKRTYYVISNDVADYVGQFGQCQNHRRTDTTHISLLQSGEQPDRERALRTALKSVPANFYCFTTSASLAPDFPPISKRISY